MKTSYWVVYKDDNGSLCSEKVFDIRNARKIVKKAHELRILWKIINNGKKETLEVIDCYYKDRIGQKLYCYHD